MMERDWLPLNIAPLPPEQEACRTNTRAEAQAVFTASARRKATRDTKTNTKETP